ncbi:MAG: septal ring lytic transglycosylase RlpA family protein [Rhodospirillales bacterium]|nr:septal ring lytic transglycosylase RlpA family protein [Rhodospirillales bacterium]
MKFRHLKWAIIAGVLAIAPMSAIDDAAYAQRAEVVYSQKGQASWYGPGLHGRKTASGERFNQHKMTAAHRKLPLGTHATVINLENGKSVDVEINDRGPYVRGRILDVSKAAAEELGMKHSGTTPIHLYVTE